jgi:hypothetical protein
MPTDAVQNCSMEQMVLTLEDLLNNQFHLNNWLPIGNRYRTNVIENIKIDNQNANINYLDLKQYTAVSSILHCSDGWTFLSSAFKSIIAGDIPSAIFFIYYSELRALMSLFGANGISILSSRHYFFGTVGDGHLSKKVGTHAIVQTILDEYIANTTKSTLLLKLIKVGNHTIDEWLRATGHIPTYIMTDFLSQWGLDINEVKSDHDSRNEVSYRPHNLASNTYKYSYKEYLEQILDFWRLCEPAGSSSFNLLDLYILKKSLQKVFNNRPFNTNSSNIDRINDPSYLIDFKEYVSNLNQNLGSPLMDSQIDILTSFHTPFDQFLEQANKKAYDATINQYDPIPMLARSLFLLRFATAGVNKIIKDANIKKDDIGFWWKEYGNMHGFWAQNDYPDDFIDSLWPDIDEILKDIKEKTTDTAYNFDNPTSMDAVPLREINCLTQLNKIPLWSFAI